ncbi:MAG TPA: PPOX class F420-dependent oxidoreductase [Nocardia sp.]|uniref:PPOX class F420-dependent oxidoreductase n=1 Tax=Nocardia TaxID=1817 RepID=UPI002459002C|nr:MULTISPECIES: PPOX class F420-dependent oxidoreductase [Nocardia]HLS78454.1 PPOX class F420-dependent oxidoreductase [Nocardia sp.]
MTNAFGEAATADYVMLTTYRKDGTPVGTPLWAVADGGKLYMWTVTDSWKVKRLKRNPRVLVQACDARGKKLSGQPVEATARVLDAEGTEHVRTLLKRKYKLLAWIALVGSNLRRGKAGTVGLEITPAS